MANCHIIHVSTLLKKFLIEKVMSRSLMYLKSKLYTVWDLKKLKSMLVINGFCKVKSLNTQTTRVGLARENRKKIKQSFLMRVHA